MEGWKGGRMEEEGWKMKRGRMEDEEEGWKVGRGWKRESERVEGWKRGRVDKTEYGKITFVESISGDF